MKKLLSFSILTLACTGALAAGRVIIPSSTVRTPAQIATSAHTNHVLYAATTPNSSVSSATPLGETPQSISDVYNFTPGGQGTIAIVTAFDYPTAENDLNVFSNQFNLPTCTTANGCFSKAYVNKTAPAVNCAWAQEAALDIQWAHAMAPRAKIVLVEANSNLLKDMFKAVDVASGIVRRRGGGQVSMSWGTDEYPAELLSDYHFFAGAKVVYFASSGDISGLTTYPAASPYVVSVGGTRINRDSEGAFLNETGWLDGGGGSSAYERRPPYQDSVKAIVGKMRGIPDVAFDADPASGVSVYDSTGCRGSSGWLVVGGTSVGAPAFAGIVNSAGRAAVNSFAELKTIYANRNNPTNFTDITDGGGFFGAVSGWDFVTGVGTSLGLAGK